MYHYSLSTLLRSAAGLVSIYIAYTVYSALRKKSAQRQCARRNGCEPAKNYPYRYPFGIDVGLDDIKMFREHTMLQQYKQRFTDLGCTTFASRFLWMRLIFTCEPENIKAILATDFTSYSVGEDRKAQLRPIFGDGIFTTDGAAWQHSRDLLRPCFARSQIGDTDLFEKHFQHLLNAIPRDNSTVDLQDLFFRLTLDIATEFLLGQSTNTLVPEKRRPEDDQFVEAFTYTQNILEGKQGILTLFLPDRRFTKSCKIVHGESHFITESLEPQENPVIKAKCEFSQNGWTPSLRNPWPTRSKWNRLSVTMVKNVLFCSMNFPRKHQIRSACERKCSIFFSPVATPPPVYFPTHGGPCPKTPKFGIVYKRRSIALRHLLVRGDPSSKNSKT